MKPHDTGTLFDEVAVRRRHTTAHLDRPFDIAPGVVHTAPDAAGLVREAATAMAAAGLVDVDPRPEARPWRAGAPEVRLIAHTTHLPADRLLAAGPTPARPADVRRVPADERFVATTPVVCSVQGRKPA